MPLTTLTMRATLLLGALLLLIASTFEVKAEPVRSIVTGQAVHERPSNF